MFKAMMGGHSWSRGPQAHFATIEDCREFAESYGTTADWCEVSDDAAVVVAMFRRGNGGDWFDAETAR